MALGPVSDVSLAEARQLAIEARKLTREGRDPIEVRDEAQAALKVAALKTITFQEAALDFLQTAKIDSFKNAVHRKQWRSTLETYAFPVLGDLPLQSIDSAIVLASLAASLEARRQKPASRLRGRIERVFEWARPLGLFEGPNPASREILKDHLPVKAKAKHHAALPYADLPAFMVELRQRDSVSARGAGIHHPDGRANLRGDRRNMERDRYGRGSLDDPSRQHEGQARPSRATDRSSGRDTARRCRESGEVRFVFINGGGMPLSNQAMSELLKGMVPPERATVHGFRSAFSDWARDCTAYPRDVIEQCLAHVIKDKSEAAYGAGMRSTSGAA